MRTDYRHPMLGTVALFFKVTERDVTLMLREAGVTVDGRIYYEDFLKIMAGQIGQQQKRVSLLQATEAEVTNGLKSGENCSPQNGALSQDEQEIHGEH